MKMIQPFTQAEFEAASLAWGCNCGPSALAFAVQLPLEAARHAIPDFDRKRYTSPTMMKAAIEFLGRRYTPRKPPPRPKRPYLNDIENLTASGGPELVRVQWTGPWTEPGMNPKWAYGHTHWICVWRDHERQMVFDCNGGVRSLVCWEDEIAPVLAAAADRRDGGWFYTHVWLVSRPV